MLEKLNTDLAQTSSSTIEFGTEACEARIATLTALHKEAQEVLNRSPAVLDLETWSLCFQPWIGKAMSYFQDGVDAEQARTAAVQSHAASAAASSNPLTEVSHQDIRATPHLSPDRQKPKNR